MKASCFVVAGLDPVVVGGVGKKKERSQRTEREETDGVELELIERKMG